jgi:hypothetical protein
MKPVITYLAILIWTAIPALAELTGVSITVHQVREVKPSHIRITGYLYSLKSSFAEESLTRVQLTKLLEKIPVLRNAGSVVLVDITADHDVSSHELGKILMAMNKNGHLTLQSIKANPLDIGAHRDKASRTRRR